MKPRGGSGRVNWTAAEIADALRLYRLGYSYRQIGITLGRCNSSVGYVIRREDLAEEARLLAEEERQERKEGKC